MVYVEHYFIGDNTFQIPRICFFCIIHFGDRIGFLKLHGPKELNDKVKSRSDYFGWLGDMYQMMGDM